MKTWSRELTMFDRDADYPTAVASYDAGGVREAIEWCVRHMEKGDTLTVWTAVKSSLSNCAELEHLVARHGDVEHVTGRGGGFVRGPGPLLMAWADMDDIGKALRGTGRHVRALAVITWNEEALRPWVSAVRPQVLGDAAAWAAGTARLDPLLEEALGSLTTTVNHSNTISAGFDKELVVGTLLALHDAHVPMDGPSVQGWALANGWSGGNPTRLAKYVEDITAGRRPRCRHVLRPDYVDSLRRKLAERGA